MSTEKPSVRLIYEYLGLKAIPNDWFDGKVIGYKYEPCWYVGSEVVDESVVDKRVKELTQITSWQNIKKYRNIRILRPQ